MADETKIWYKSKGIWAGFITLLFGIYSLVQTSFPQIHLFNLAPVAPIIFTVLGAFGFYGRMNADGKIVFSDKKSN